jgi:large subunit ribosomal protein L1
MTKEKKTEKEVKEPKKKFTKKNKGEAKVKKTFDYEKGKAYTFNEAVELVKKFSKTKFDASLEVHFRLGIDPRKGDQQVRAAVSLPHGTGKTIRVAAFVSPENEDACKQAGADIAGGEDLINKIKETEKTEFDVAVADPGMMKFLAKIAKILGTRGLMPSPKNDTVSANPAKAVADLKKGKVSFKNDDTANLHVAIGRISFDNNKLKENFETIVDAVKKTKPPTSKGVFIKNVVICSTMGPGIKVQL